MNHDPMPVLTRTCAWLAPLFAIVAFVGFAVVIGSRSMSEAAQEPAIFVPTIAALASVLALGATLVGLFQATSDSLGSFGRAAFVVALLGSMLVAGAQWSYVFVVPYFDEAAPKLVDSGQGILLAGFIISYATFAIGWVLLGLALMHAGVLSRGIGTFLVVGAAVSFLPLPSRTLLLAIAALVVVRHVQAGSSPSPAHSAAPEPVTA